MSRLSCLAFRASPSASLVQHDSKLHPCLTFRASPSVPRLPCLAFRASPSAPRLPRLSSSTTVNCIRASPSVSRLPCLAFRAFAPTARLIQFDYRTLQQQLNYVIPLQISPSLPISPASSGPNASPRQVQPHSPVPRPSVLPSFSASP